MLPAMGFHLRIRIFSRLSGKLVRQKIWKPNGSVCGRKCVTAGAALRFKVCCSSLIGTITTILAALPLFSTPGFGQTLPTLPQATVDTTMPPITGNTYGVNAGGDLQAAINQAAANNPNLNHLIVLQAGASFPGPFTLPARAAGTGWIILQSSAIGSLPLEGRRVKPSDSPNMPQIVVDAHSGGAIQTASGTYHFRFIGIEIRPLAGMFIYNLVELGGGEL